MRRTVLIPCLILLACASPVGRQSAMPADAVDALAAMDWLAGNWVGPSPRGSWEARYSSSAGGLILSANKEIVDGKAVSFEFEQFYVEGDDVVMQPFIRGVKGTASFRMTASDPAARRAVFENPQHDFPNIITYHRTSDDTLKIKVQGREGTRLVGFELNLTRRD